MVVCEPKGHPRLPSRFYVASTETTFKQYKFVTKSLPAAARQDLGDDYPVNCVSWIEAKRFCELIGSALRLAAKEVRLPREVDWQYLAGREPPQPLSSFALYGESESTAPDRVKGKRKPDAAGIYDLRGNVCEWLDGSGPGANIGTSRESKVREHFTRGGSRDDDAADLEQRRSFAGEVFSGPLVGFRIIVVPAAK